jgi:3alpha(or 20beta)-hydroxysteroid dehydrogenase
MCCTWACRCVCRAGGPGDLDGCRRHQGHHRPRGARGHRRHPQRRIGRRAGGRDPRRKRQCRTCHGATGFSDAHLGVGISGSAARRRREPQGSEGRPVTQRVALVTGAARGQGWAITQRLRADGFSVAACDVNAAELRAAVDGLGDDAVIGIPLDVTLEWEWQQAVAKTVDKFGSLTTLINNAGLLHRASISDESHRRIRKSLAGQLFGRLSGYPRLAGSAAGRRRRRHRQHLQHRGDQAVPEPHRLRLGQVGAARADPGRRGRTRPGGYPRQRGVSRSDRDADARRGDPGAAGGHIGVRPDRAAVRGGRCVAFLVSGKASFITGSELVIDGGQCLKIQ